MFKYHIKYENFDGQEVEEDLYFHFTEPEVTALFSNGESKQQELERKMQRGDLSEMLKEYTDIVLSAYGEKSEDGRHFRKNEQIRGDFLQSAAYAQLFMDFNTNPNLMLEFFRGLFPKGFKELVDAHLTEEAVKQKTAELTGQAEEPIEAT